MSIEEQIRSLGKAMEMLKKRQDKTDAQTNQLRDSMKDAIKEAMNQGMIMMRQGFDVALEKSTKLLLEGNRRMIQEVLPLIQLQDKSESSSKKRKAIQEEGESQQQQEEMVKLDKRMDPKAAVVMLMTIFVFGMSTGVVKIIPENSGEPSPKKKQKKQKKQAQPEKNVVMATVVHPTVVHPTGVHPTGVHPTVGGKSPKVILTKPLVAKIAARLLFIVASKFCTGASNIWGIPVTKMCVFH